MATSLYFYDLETTGFNAREARVMQFAGQRTDLELNPIGEPHNILIKLTDEILPDPDAILVTGITPQQTMADGITEAAFLRLFHDEIATPDTVFVGYNTIRFDDEFMRFMHYRNFYDAYEWQWQDGRSRWDMLDVVRMTRALRPEGIQWPFDSAGKPTNRLELLTKVNKLDHFDAHDALSDVQATIAVAKLIQTKQPKLFTYLLEMRTKNKVAELVEGGRPFVYTSGKYSGAFEKTTVVGTIMPHPKKQGMLVYDLRVDPEQFADKTAEQLVDLWKYTKDEAAPPRLPVKVLQYNRCPAIAPLGVLDESSIQRLQLDLEGIKQNHARLQKMSDFATKLQKALEIMDKAMQARFITDEGDVDGALYDGFVANKDKTVMSAIRASEPQELSEFASSLTDSRLQKLLPLYKARNYPKSLTSEERESWEAFRHQRLLGGGKQNRLQRYITRLQELAATKGLSDQKQYLLQELHLYAESILPDTDA